MALFVSTNDNPLNFLKCYLNNNGEEYLIYRFQSVSDPDFSYNPQTNTIYVQRILPRADKRGELLDEETNTREFELSFEEFAVEEFKTQLRTTIAIINDLSKVRSDDLKLDLYKQILVEGLEIKKAIDNQSKLNYRFYLNRSIRSILEYAYRKFEKYHPDLIQMKQVEDYYTSLRSGNITGFKRKISSNNVPLQDIFERIRDEQFVHTRAKFKSFSQFMRGEFPKHRLDWNKELCELRYFIYQLTESGGLENPPRQQWKYMNSIFTYKGNELPKNWHRNNNKLQVQAKKDAIDRIIRMFQPRQE